jgi:hypothetical protein
VPHAEVIQTPGRQPGNIIIRVHEEAMGRLC